MDTHLHSLLHQTEKKLSVTSEEGEGECMSQKEGKKIHSRDPGGQHETIFSIDSSNERYNCSERDHGSMKTKTQNIRTYK